MALTDRPAPLRLRRLIVVSALAFAFVGLIAPAAGAHAVLTETEPSIDEVTESSPDSVTIHFSEPVEIALGAVRVYDTDARRVDEGATEHPDGDSSAVQVPLRSDLPDGTYTVTWRVVSADGHPIKGACVFLVLVWRRRGKALARPPEVESAFATRWRRLVGWGWGLAVVGTASSIVLQGAVAGGVGVGEAIRPAVISEVLDTRYGSVGLIRLGLLVVLAAVYATARARRVWPVRAGLDEPASVGAAALTAPFPPAAVALCGLLLGFL